MRPSTQGKHFPEGFLTAGNRLWKMQVRQTGWSESCTQGLQPPSIHSFPWEQGCGTTSGSQGQSKRWKTHTCTLLIQVWLIKHQLKWNKGRKGGRTLECHTLASPITANLPPCLIPFHPQDSLFISPGNSCPDVSPSGEKRQMPHIYSINRNI